MKKPVESDEEDDRNPEVEALAEEDVRRIDPQRLLVRAEAGVEHHVQSEEPRAA